MERRWFRDIKRALEIHGITALGFKDGKKHTKIRITDGRTTCFVVTSASPSDVRTLNNLASTAKRALAERNVS